MILLHNLQSESELKVFFMSLLFPPGFSTGNIFISKKESMNGEPSLSDSYKENNPDNDVENQLLAEHKATVYKIGKLHIIFMRV